MPTITTRLSFSQQSPVLPVQGYVKNYHWGKVSNDSYIARFQAQSNGQSDKNGPKKPLAELWFGSHPSGPSTITVDKQSIKLDAFLAKYPEMVGNINQYFKFNKKLPFLFKILSIGQPLSLQAHPDKKLAPVLHEKDPKNYPDPNHKPELAIALTQFEVLCDFRPTEEIIHFMKILAPFRKVIGDKNCEDYFAAVAQTDHQRQRASLAKCFKALMTCDKDLISKEAKEILAENGAAQIDKDLIKLVAHLNELYPGDPGLLAPFFLNYLKLAPGQAVYLRANKLHAYIRGECIECMACSDNVVRAGLTTKYRDLDTLTNMLDYETVKNLNDVLLTSTKHGDDPCRISFEPTEEFKVDKITIDQKNCPNGEYTMVPLLSGSFIVVMDGKAMTKNFFNLSIEHKLTLGSAGFIPPKVTLKLHNIQGTLIIYRSYC